MYKISIINGEFQYKEIPVGLKSDLLRPTTFEEWERGMAQNSPNVYFQEALPKDTNGDVILPMYWKVVDTTVAAMTDERVFKFG